MITLRHLELIRNNSDSITISKYIKEDDFFVMFLVHLQQFFESKRKNLYFTEPFFSDFDNVSDSSYLEINNVSLGQIFYLYNEKTKLSTMFLYSEVLNIKFYLLDKENLHRLTVKRYCFLLEALLALYDSIELSH